MKQLDLSLNKIIKRAWAIENGERFFFTGKPCKWGHIALRYAKGGSCVKCQGVENMLRLGLPPERAGILSEKQKTRQKAQNENKKIYVPLEPCRNGHRLRWTGTNNCVECDKDVRKRHIISAKFSRIKKEYNLTKNQYLELVHCHNSACAVCFESPESHFRLHIDHCHKTQKVRGLLCGRCNQALGLLRESISIIKSLENYLNDRT